MRIEPKFRCASGKSMSKLAKILKVPITYDMQDWEWEIADQDRISEYITLYKQDHMNDDDRIALMETIIQCVDDLYSAKYFPPKQWKEVKRLIKRNSVIHQYTIFYWSGLEAFVPCFYTWYISKEMSKLYLELYKKC